MWSVERRVDKLNRTLPAFPTPPPLQKGQRPAWNISLGQTSLAFLPFGCPKTSFRLEELKKLSCPSGRGWNDPPLSVAFKFRGSDLGLGAVIHRPAEIGPGAWLRDQTRGGYLPWASLRDSINF